MRLMRFLACLLAGGASVLAQPVVINEIMYHPYEDEAFVTNQAPGGPVPGTPLLDLTHDIHEYVELYNYGATNISLAGWKLTGGIDFEFATNAVIRSGQYLVIGKDRTRLLAIKAYRLTAQNLLGNFTGNLGNDGDTVRLRNEQGKIVDSVTYYGNAPWPIGANGMGAASEWTGVQVATNYTGRSLERLSPLWPGNDPANWIASPIKGIGTPGARNSQTIPSSQRAPYPVVLQTRAVQDSDGARIIRSTQPVRVECRFSSTNLLVAPSLEWYVENIDATNETHTVVELTKTDDPAFFKSVIPAKPDRSVIRYRILSRRGTNMAVVSPRPDDPPKWHSYFVSPVRTSTNVIYDLFISSASLARLNANISQSPRRVTSPDPPGMPRASWNATEPAIFVHDGVVYDVQFRHHGSRYRRSEGRHSYKIQFPDYQPFTGSAPGQGSQSAFFVTDKSYDDQAGHLLYEMAGLPTIRHRGVDFYMNNNAVIVRSEQEEYGKELMERFLRDYNNEHPDGPAQLPGGAFYKCVGLDAVTGEGPYGRGDGRMLVQKPSSKYTWAPWERYNWTYAREMEGWRGSITVKGMIDELWKARGDTPEAATAPNAAAVKSYLEKFWDIDRTLTYLAIKNWSSPWDDTFQNWVLWQNGEGRWCILPWDLDEEFGGTPYASGPAFSIFDGEVGISDDNALAEGPHFIKDAFFKAIRQQYVDRLFILNNTLLHPNSIKSYGMDRFYGSTQLGAPSGAVNANIFLFSLARFNVVNEECQKGPYLAPFAPTHVAPPNGAYVTTNTSLQATAFSHPNPMAVHGKTTWQIRAAGNSYKKPVMNLTTNSLTSLPIPFNRLKYGQTYFWRVIYYDTDNHPSAASQETSFVFGYPDGATQPVLTLDASWQYQDAGEQAPGWEAAGFNDSGWKSGQPYFGRTAGAALLPSPGLRTVIAQPQNTYYFRSRFVVTNFTASTLLLKGIFDDGALIYLNGREVLRIGMPDGPIGFSTNATRDVDPVTWEGPYAIPGKYIVPGTNVLAVELHQSSNAVPDALFGLTLDARQSDLVINEVMADNRSGLLNGNDHPDWVEIHNHSTQPMPLDDVGLTDDIDSPLKFRFPKGASIAAGGYLLVWGDGRLDAPGLHTGFGLNNSGQTLYLVRSNATGIVIHDSVNWGLQAPDISIGRIPDGAGPFQANRASPGTNNVAQPTAPVSALRINEWMANPGSGNGWVEVFNTTNLPVSLAGASLSDQIYNAPTHLWPELSFMAPGDRVVFNADGEKGGFHLPFELNITFGQLGIFDSAGKPVESLSYGPQLPGASQGRLPDGAPGPFVVFQHTESPGDPNYLPIPGLVINEILSNAADPLENAVELYNAGATAAPVAGFYLGDSKTNPKCYRIPAGTPAIPAGGYRVFYQAQFSGGDLPNPLRLDSNRGGAVYLFAADAAGNLTGYRAGQKFGAAERNVSVGRYLTSQSNDLDPDAGVDFVAMSRRTFGSDNPASVQEFRAGSGATNAYPKVGPLVITEIMYHPVSGSGTNIVENADEEYLELKNITPSPVLLCDPSAPSNTWQFRDGIDFAFPPNVSIPAGAFFLIVHFDPSDKKKLSDFRTRYNVPASTPVFGPYSGRLDNSGEAIGLYKPGPAIQPPAPDAGFVPYILVERVAYADVAPWPSDADGTGKALHRKAMAEYGNDPINWIADVPGPGFGLVRDSDGDGMPDDWESAYGLDPQVNDGALDKDRDGQSNLAEYLSGTRPDDASSVLKFISVNRSSGQVELRFEAVAGVQYMVQFRDGSVGVPGWQNLATPLSTATQVISVFDPNPGPARFYRLSAQPPP